MKTAAVAVVGGGVVGGGVIGASVAYHLAANGVRDIVVVDRGRPAGASGSTTKATGGFRAQFSTPINVQLSLLAREKLLRFQDEIGTDPGFDQFGYLWLAGSAAELEMLRDALVVQNAEGLAEAVELGTAEIGDVNPAVAPDQVIGGAFCPTDGFLRPRAVRKGYIAAAENLGVDFQWESEVIGMTLGANDSIEELHTSGGMIDVERVVNAAGPWAAGVALMAEAEIPVFPLRRQVAVTERVDVLPSNMPMTIFVADGFHTRVRDGCILLLRPSPGVEDDPFNTSVDTDWLDDVAAIARTRIPALSSVRVDRASSYAGLYEMSPDGHAILGLSPDCGNLYLANGSSGHGVMHAPALGGLLADVICGKIPPIDIGPLRPSRFTDGSAPARAELL